jgi:outer membrane receptor for ferric coprogen and ferric-rhodotorulic acid
VFLVDLMAKYALNDKVDITFNVKNLLNEKHYVGLGNFDTGYYGEPRSFSVSTKFKF